MGYDCKRINLGHFCKEMKLEDNDGDLIIHFQVIKEAVTPDVEKHVATHMAEAQTGCGESDYN